MEYALQNLGPLQSFLISLLGIFFTAGTLALVFRQVSGKSIQASDGTRFSSEEARNSYELAIEKLKPLYEENDINTEKMYGFTQGFLHKLKVSGFKDLQSLVRFKSDIQKLVDLLDVEQNS